MRVTIEDGVYSLVIEVKIESMFDKGKGRMILYSFQLLLCDDIHSLVHSFIHDKQTNNK